MNIQALIRVIIKFPLFAMLLSLYFLASTIVTILCGFSLERARGYLTKIIALTSRVGLIIIGVEVVSNKKPESSLNNYLIVSNHLSYLDVLTISSLYPSCFVTSKEMKKTFFLGQLCLLGGCLFVDRKNKSNIHNEVRELTNSLTKGLNVAIFPEAKSTDGSEVIHFKRPLFQAAMDSGAKVLPMCLNYKSINGVEVSRLNRDLVFWYGDQAFLDHALKLFSQKKMVIELSVLNVIRPQEFSGKTELSHKCHELISGNYKKINS